MKKIRKVSYQYQRRQIKANVAAFVRDSESNGNLLDNPDASLSVHDSVQCNMNSCMPELQHVQSSN